MLLVFVFACLSYSLVYITPSQIMRIASAALSLFSGVQAVNCHERDLMLWKNNRSFTDTFRSISRKSLGRRKNAAALFHETYPSMTLSCAQCHANMIGCGADNCLVFCRKAEISLECKLCIREHCLQEYSTCLGFSGDDLPLEP